jgi:membrane associated rhomboid family serine protease
MFTPAVQFILICNVAVFGIEQFGADNLAAELALWPIGTYFAPWQVFTYAFAHGGFTHIAFNMLGLVMFGSDVERVWGSQRFMLYYLVAILSAAACQLAFSALTGSPAPMVGASGGVFGLLLAFALLFPERKIFLIFLPIPLPARVFAGLYALVELVMGVTGTQAGVAHFAHLGGMLGGYVYLLLAGRGWRR